jgi:hypothetical protein
MHCAPTICDGGGINLPAIFIVAGDRQQVYKPRQLLDNSLY